MRLIYVDEAGTSPAEPVRVVAGVIVDADNEARALAAEIKRIVRERVPQHLQDGFIFHAKEVFNGGRRIKREEWAFEDRLDFYKEIICLPQVHDLPIALGVILNGAFDDDMTEEQFAELAPMGITKPVFEHGMAFSNCLAKADLFLRKYLGNKEVGVVVAENIDNARRGLATLAMLRRNHPITLPGSDMTPDYLQRRFGEQPQDQVIQISNIIDVPHFVAKNGAPLLQLADACAFAVRRFLSKQPRGDELMLAMLGPGAGGVFIKDDAWFSGNSAGLFTSPRYWSDEQRALIQNRERAMSIADFLIGAIGDVGAEGGEVPTTPHSNDLS